MERKENKLQKKKVLILTILFCVGIIFLFLSEYHSYEGSGSLSAVEEDKAYTENLEMRLSEIISEIHGAGKSRVMITLKGSSKNEFATEKSSASDSVISTFLLQKDASGNTQPILIKTSAPEILGVSVVCPGAKDPEVKRKILELVAGTLNLNQNQIYVTY